MANIKSESLAWVDQLSALTAEREKKPNAKNGELAKAIHVHKSMVTFLTAIGTCFDPAAIEKVRQAASPSPNSGTSSHSGTQQANPPYILSFNSALALAGLKGKTPNLPEAVHAALDITLSRQLDTRHIKVLVEWVSQGKPAGEFDPQQKMTSGSPGRRKPEAGHVENRKNLSINGDKTAPLTPAEKGVDINKLAELTESAKAEKERGDGKTAAQEKLTAYLGSLSHDPEDESPVAPAKRARGKKAPSGKPSLFLEWASGVSIFSQLKSKTKKGEKLTLGDWGLLLLRGLGKIWHWIHKDLFKWFKEAFQFVWNIVVDSLKILGIYKFVRAVVVLALLVCILWAGWDIHQHGIYHPLHVIESLFPKKTQAAETTTPPTPVPVVAEEVQPQAKTEKKAAKSAAPSHSITIASSAVSAFSESSGFERACLEKEIAAVPLHSVIQTLYFEPDWGMRVDMATSRIGDMADPNKYTLMMGKDKKIIVNVIPSFTKFTLTYKDPSPIGLIDGPTKMEFYWVDLREFHVSMIETQTRSGIQKTYQLSFIVNGLKQPLTLQCSAVEDMENLISGLEVWAKSTRDGKAVPITGMPYLNQGLKLDHDSQMVTLWAGSPIDKSGLKLGDHPWSMKDRDQQQTPAQLEAALQALTPGDYKFYIITARNWKQGIDDKTASPTNEFDPFRTTVRLQVQ